MSQTIHIGVFIDGTGNHWDNDKIIGNGTQSNVAKLAEVFKLTEGNLEPIYVPGVGTKSFEELGFIDQYGNESQEIKEIRAGKIDITDFYDKIAMGSGRDIMGRGVKSQVNEALHKIKSKLDQLDKTNPDAKIELDIITFSRGSASGRDLSNELRKQGLLDEKTQINLLGLFDTVSSINFADGNNHGVNVNVDENTARHIIHYTAADEIRENFRLESIPEIDKLYTGAHADIGGAYGILDNKEFYIIEDSKRSITVHNNELNAKIDELQKDAEARGYGLYYDTYTNNVTAESVITSAYVEEKDIKFGLSTITLNDMYHQMKEDGIPMTDLNVLGNVKNNPQYSNWEIPQELQENPYDERYIHTSYVGKDRVVPVEDHYERPSPLVILSNAPEENYQRSIDINNPVNAIGSTELEEFSKSLDRENDFKQDSTTTTRPEETYYESSINIQLSSSIEDADEIAQSSTQSFDSTAKAQEVFDRTILSDTGVNSCEMDYGLEIGD